MPQHIDVVPRDRDRHVDADMGQINPVMLWNVCGVGGRNARADQPQTSTEEPDLQAALQPDVHWILFSI